MMKRKTAIAPVAALSIALFSAPASAVLIDFIDLTEGPAGPGNLGESAWDVLSLPGAFGLEITGHTLAGVDDDNDQFAYLDWGNAGLGMCKDATSIGANSGSSSNVCNPGSDDNVTRGEYLEMTFDADVKVDLWFNNNHDGGFGAGDSILINNVSYDVMTGYAGGANGIGTFMVAAGDVLRIEYENEEFYVSGMEVNAVPLPAAIWLFGSALIGFVGLGRRRSVS